MGSSEQKKDFLSTAGGMVCAAVLANLLWGSAAPVIKLGYRFFSIEGDDTMSVLLFAGVRFTLAGVLTVLLGSVMSRRALLPGRGSWGMVALLALNQTVLQYSFFYIGLSHVPAYRGTIISPTSTFFALLIAALVFRQEKLTAKKLLGCLVGFAGVGVVTLSGRTGGAVRLDGDGFLVLAAASYGWSSVLTKRFSAREDPVALSGWQFVLGGALMTAASLLGGGRLRAVTAAAWPVMAYLSMLSAVAYTLSSLLLKRHHVSRIAVFSFLNPVFGVFLSALLLGEGGMLDLPRCLLALALVCLGVWTVNRPEERRA